MKRPIAPPPGLDTIGKRLRWARQKFRQELTSAAAAARAMGIVESTYQGHENDNRGSQKLEYDVADRYARFYKISLEWLLVGRGLPRAQGVVQQRFDSLVEGKQRRLLEYLDLVENSDL